MHSTAFTAQHRVAYRQGSTTQLLVQICGYIEDRTCASSKAQHSMHSTVQPTAKVPADTTEFKFVATEETAAVEPASN